MKSALDALLAQAQSGPAVIVLRGVSGSGKSTLASELVSALQPAACVVASADVYFGAGASYRFDASQLGAAHAHCRSAFDAAVHGRAPYVILDNTNTAFWEYAAYLASVRSFNEAVAIGRVAGVPWPPFCAPGGDVAATPTADDADGAVGVAAGDAGNRDGGWAARGYRTAESLARSFPPGTPRRADHAAPPPGGGGGGDSGTYSIVVVEFECADAAMASHFAARNAHGVPADKVLQMYDRLRADPHPGAIRVAAAAGRSPAGVVASPSLARRGGGGAAVAPWAAQPQPVLPVAALAALAERVVFVGAFLGRASRAAALEAFPPAHPLVYCDHVTLLHAPPRRLVTPALLSLVGQRVELALGPCHADAEAQAAEAAWAPSAAGDARAAAPGTARVRELLRGCLVNGLSINAVPHVTVSTAVGVPPSVSNAMLERGRARRGGRAARRAPPTIILVDAVFGLALAPAGGAAATAPRRYVLSQPALRAFLAEEELGVG